LNLKANKIQQHNQRGKQIESFQKFFNQNKAFSSVFIVGCLSDYGVHLHSFI